jgi:hypothetical protein
MPTSSTDQEILTWPRWLGRGFLVGCVFGLGAMLFVLGQAQDGDGLSLAEGLGVGAVFTVGGFLAGLWQQIRPTWLLAAHPGVWGSWRAMLVGLVAVGAIAYLAGYVSGS